MYGEKPCVAIDEGPEVSEWLSRVLQSEQAVRLVRMANDFQRQQSEEALQGGIETEKNQNHVYFAYAAPYLITNEASLIELNKNLIRSGEQPVPMNRFRPNIVIKGLAAFAEHKLQSISNSEYELQLKLACERCVITTIDQHTGQRDPKMQPFKTLQSINGTASERSNPLFGQYATLVSEPGHSIAVGDVLAIGLGEH